MDYTSYHAIKELISTSIVFYFPHLISRLKGTCLAVTDWSHPYGMESITEKLKIL